MRINKTKMSYLLVNPLSRKVMKIGGDLDIESTSAPTILLLLPTMSHGQFIVVSLDIVYQFSVSISNDYTATMHGKFRHNVFISLGCL